MASIKQIEANRRNSQHSTGPRTAAGKAVSRANAMSTGIYAQSLAIRGEDPRALEQLTAEYYRQLHPVTPRERDLVDAIVRNEWILRRMGLVEAELWNHYFKSTDVTQPGSRWDVINRDFMLAQGFIAIGANLERLQRRISAVERSTARARAELAALRADQGDCDELADAATEPTLAPIIGFVPSKTQTAPSEDRAEASSDPQTSSPEPRTPNPEPQIGFVPSIFPAASSEPLPLAVLIPDPRPLTPAEGSEARS